MSTRDVTGTPTRAARRQSLSKASEDVDETPEKSSMQVKRHMDLKLDNNTPLTPTRRSSRVVSSPAVKKTTSLIPSVSESVASPMRRTTRSMSQEKELQPPPPTSFRLTRRRSSIMESEEEVENKKDNALPTRSLSSRSAVTARKSILLNETINEEVAEEEEKDLNNSTDNELELRNRSISKSPNVSMNSSLSTNSDSVIDKVEEAKVAIIDSFISDKSFNKPHDKKRHIIEKQSVNSPERATTANQLKSASPRVTVLKVADSNTLNKSLNEVKANSPKKKLSLPTMSIQLSDASVIPSPTKTLAATTDCLSPTKTSKMSSLSPSKSSQLKSWDKPFLNHSGSPIDRFVKQISSPSKILDGISKFCGSFVDKTSKLSQSVVDKNDSESEESDSSKRNLYIDDECEVKSNVEDGEDTMSEDEKQYLAENEVVDEGEILGSDDTEEELEGENDDEDDSSFIDDDDVSDKYSMNSEEEAIEEENLGKSKTLSRVIRDSSSEEDSDGDDKNNDVKQKTTLIIPVTIEEDYQCNLNAAEESDFGENMEETTLKEELERVDEISVDRNSSKVILASSGKKKTPKKLVNNAENKGNAKRRLDESNEDIEAETKRAKKRKLDESLNGDAVLINKKKLKPNNEQAKLPTPEENLTDSSEKPDIIESVMSTCTDYIEKFNEEKRKREALKRARKAEKLAKKKEEETKDQSDSSKENSTIKKKKKNKSKIKKPKSVEDAKQERKEDIGITAMEIMEKREHKRRAKIEKKKLKKQMKAQAITAEIDEKVNLERASGVVDNSKKNLQQQKNSEAPGKKRKFSQVLDVSENVVYPEIFEKPKKKLKMISNIEENTSKKKKITMPSAGDKDRNDDIKLVSASAKIRKIVHNPVKVEKSKTKDKKSLKIPENRPSLPRPVWSTSGVWIEEPTTPFKFSKVTYTPIHNSGTPDSFSVASLLSKSKSNEQVAKLDFRTNAVLQKKAGRDGSIKNIKGLMKTKSSQKW